MPTECNPNLFEFARAQLRSSVRRISIAMASACPWQDESALTHAMLRKAGA